MMRFTLVPLTLILAACSSAKAPPGGKPFHFGLTQEERNKLPGCEARATTLSCPETPSEAALKEVEASIEARMGGLRAEQQQEASKFLTELTRLQQKAQLREHLVKTDFTALNAIVERAFHHVLAYECKGGFSGGQVAARFPLGKLADKSEGNWKLALTDKDQVAFKLRDDAITLRVFSDGEWIAKTGSGLALDLSCLKVRESGATATITDRPTENRRLACQTKSFYLQGNERKAATWGTEFTIHDDSSVEEVAAPDLEDTVYAKLKYGVRVQSVKGHLHLTVHDRKKDVLEVETSNSAPTVGLSFGDGEADEVQVVCKDANKQ